MMPYCCVWDLGTFWMARIVAGYRWYTFIICFRTGISASMMSSPSSTAKGSSPDHPLGRQHRMAEPQRLFLADIAERHQVRDALHLGQQFVLALGLEVLFQFEGHVEVVLDRPLAPARDQHDLFDARGDRLLHHVLDERLVHERQHLLGRRLCCRQKPGAQPGGGKNRFGDPVVTCISLDDIIARTHSKKLRPKMSRTEPERPRPLLGDRHASEQIFQVLVVEPQPDADKAARPGRCSGSCRTRR